MSAKPLNVGANGKPAPSSVAKKAGTSDTKTPAKATAAVKPEEISSPHELTAFVEHLLSQLETKFDDMSNQVLDKMTSMSNRVDALENSIQELINDTFVPGQTAPPTPLPRSDSGRSDSFRPPPIESVDKD